MSVNVLYHTKASATGGRDGHVKSADGDIDLQLVVPTELGGPGGAGANPEKLFAAGYSACFLGALRFVAGQEKVTIPADASVSAEVGIGPRSDGGFGITAALTVKVDGIDRPTLEALVEKANFVCPYSNATKGNIAFSLTIA